MKKVFHQELLYGIWKLPNDVEEFYRSCYGKRTKKKYAKDLS